MAKVVAVCKSEKKGTIKKEAASIHCIENYGIEDDAHAGNWHRQVSLMSLSDMKMVHAEYPGEHYGVFAENILVDDACLFQLEIGTKIHIGEVILEVSQIGKECHQGCEIQKKTGKCVMPQIGIFTIVLHGGIIYPKDEITFEKPNQYEKNFGALSNEKQKEFAKKRITIVGIGALGQMVAHELIRLGCKHLVLIDPDFFSYTNQNRQLYADSKTLYQSKCEITKKQLELIQPQADIQIYKQALTSENGIRLIQLSDVVVDCVDQPNIKQLMEKLCEEVNVVLVHGAVDGWFGQVAVSYPHDHLLEKLYQGNKPRSEASLVTTVNVVASFQSSEVYKVLCEPHLAMHHQILMIDLLRNEISKVDFHS